MSKAREIGAGARLVLDLGPLIVFFVANWRYGPFAATAAFMLAILAAMGVSLLVTHRVSALQLFSGVLVLVMGGLTVWLHNETFIKIKPTILYWVLGGVLAGGQLFMRRNPMKALMGAQMELPEGVWRALGWSWSTFFFAMGALNLWVAFHFDEKTWVNFKVFGILGLMVVFVVVQAVYLGRHMKPDTPDA